MTVVDASVVVKWYIPEQDHEAARELRDDYLEGVHDLSAPHLLPFEVLNALRYSSYYAGDRLEAAGRSLSQYGLDLVPFGAVASIPTVAEAVDVTVYDAAYVALAERRDAVAYTADETLLEDLSGTGYENRLAHVRNYPA